MDITAILYIDMVHDNAENNDDDNIFLHTILHLHLYINLSKRMWRVGERQQPVEQRDLFSHVPTLSGEYDLKGS